MAQAIENTIKQAKIKRRNCKRMRIMFTVGSVDRYVDRYIARRSGRHSVDTRSIVGR